MSACSANSEKILFISFNNDFFLHTEGNIVVIKYDLLNDLFYELGSEMAFMSKSELTTDKIALIADFKKDCPEEYKTFTHYLLKTASKKLFEEDFKSESQIRFNLPEFYIEWLKYHPNPEYHTIGRIANLHYIDIAMEDLREYVAKFFEAIKKTIETDLSIQKFTFVEADYKDANFTKVILSLRDNLTYKSYDDSWVQYEVADAYFNGIGATKDIPKSITHYIRATEQGNGIAANWLGWCYQTGNGIGKNEVKALEYYKKGSELGNANSDANLGYCYHLGIGTPVDYEQAVNYYQKGAEGGILFAQVNLANIYYDGLLGSSNYKEAFKWYSNVAKLDNQLDIKFKVGKMLIEGIGVKKNEKQAYPYILSASKGGIKEAHFYLGKLIEGGFGSESVNAYDECAVEAFKLGIEAGDVKCAWAIVSIFKRNNILWKDGIDALIWLKKKKDPQGIFELASYINVNQNINIKFKRPYRLQNLDLNYKGLYKLNVDKLMEEASKRGSSDATQFIRAKNEWKEHAHELFIERMEYLMKKAFYTLDEVRYLNSTPDNEERVSCFHRKDWERQYFISDRFGVIYDDNFHRLVSASDSIFNFQVRSDIIELAKGTKSAFIRSSAPEYFQRFIGKKAASESEMNDKISLYGNHYEIKEGTEIICSYAFANCPYIKYITIPNTVKAISDYAFFNLGITSLIIPKSVEEIGGNALPVSLKTLTILNGEIRVIFTSESKYRSDYGPVINLDSEDDVFERCANLEKIYIPMGSKNRFATLFPSISNKLEEIKDPANINSQKKILKDTIISCETQEKVSTKGKAAKEKTVTKEKTVVMAKTATKEKTSSNRNSKSEKTEVKTTTSTTSRSKRTVSTKVPNESKRSKSLSTDTKHRTQNKTSSVPTTSSSKNKTTLSKSRPSRSTSYSKLKQSKEEVMKPENLKQSFFSKLKNFFK